MPFARLKKTPMPWIVGFLACFLGGYVFHLFAFSNVIPNSDGLSRIYDLQEMTVSGRWFLHYASILHGFVQMPAIIALVSLLFLSFSVVLMVDLIEIKYKYLAAALGLLFITFPSVGFTFLYLFTASAYSIGIFLSIFSLWILEKSMNLKNNKEVNPLKIQKQQMALGFLAVLLLACSMGIYQAYVSFAIGLSVILVLKKTLHQKETLPSVTISGVRYCIFLGLGAALYYLMLEMILMVTGQELLPYLGMEEEKYPFHALPSLIFSAYKQVIRFFFIAGTGTTTNPLTLLNLTVIMFGGVGLISMVKPFQKEKEQRWRLVYVVLLCCILPLALGFVQIISPWSAPTPLMQYPYVLAYVVVIFFIDNGMLRCPIEKKGVFAHVSLINFLLIGFCGGWLCNLLYTASYSAHRATENYVSRMVSRVEMTEGYQWEMPVLIIGAFPEDRYFSSVEVFDLMDHYSAAVSSVLPLNKHIYYYLNDWLHIPWEEPTEEVMISMSNSTEFLQMPLYPDDGSVKIIEDSVVVRVGETYLPKSAYEIAYENRK